MTPSEQFDIRAAIERLEVADDTLRVTAALRIAIEALAFYMGAEVDGDRAREAIDRIYEQLDPEATPSPLADVDAMTEQGDQGTGF